LEEIKAELKKNLNRKKGKINFLVNERERKKLRKNQ